MRRFARIALALSALSFAMPAEAGNIFNGRKLYMEHCARCHGNDGRPVLPGTPNFNRGEGLLAPDQIVMRSVRYGKGLMPGFEAVFRGKELLDVMAFVRSLQR